MRVSPLVTIVIPTYNRAEYLRVAVESALEQTYRNLEILILDDASPDETPAVAEALAARDDRVRYIRHADNLGLVGNWRTGVAEAQGDFFCILGDDDTLEPTFIEALLAPLVEDETLVLSFCDHWVMDEQGHRLTDRTDRNTRSWRRASLAEGPLPSFETTALINRSIFIGAVLFRRAMIEPEFLREEASAFVDLWLLYECTRQGEAYYVPQRLTTCRWQAGAVSRSWNWRLYGFEGETFCYRAFLDDPDLAAYAPIFRDRLAYALVTFGNTLLSLGRRREARDRLREALEVRVTLRALTGYLLTGLGPAGTRVSSWLRTLRGRLPGGDVVPNYPERYDHTALQPSSRQRLSWGDERQPGPESSTSRHPEKALL